MYIFLVDALLDEKSLEDEFVEKNLHRLGREDPQWFDDARAHLLSLIEREADKVCIYTVCMLTVGIFEF